MRKALPERMFSDPEQSRLVVLRNWILDLEVTEVEMSERQFWNFAQQIGGENGSKAQGQTTLAV